MEAAHNSSRLLQHLQPIAQHSQVLRAFHGWHVEESATGGIIMEVVSMSGEDGLSFSIERHSFDEVQQLIHLNFISNGKQQNIGSASDNKTNLFLFFDIFRLIAHSLQSCSPIYINSVEYKNQLSWKMQSTSPQKRRESPECQQNSLPISPPDSLQVPLSPTKKKKNNEHASSISVAPTMEMPSVNNYLTVSLDQTAYLPKNIKRSSSSSTNEEIQAQGENTKGSITTQSQSTYGQVESATDQYQQFEGNQQIIYLKKIIRLTKKKYVRGVLGLLGSFLLHSLIGSIYRWNMFSPYLSLHFPDADHLPIGAPISMLSVGLTMIVGYRLSAAYGTPLVAIISVLVLGMVATNILAAYADSPYGFIGFSNVGFGLFAGLIFLPPIKQCHKILPRMKLLTNSIILTGTGLGSVLFGALNIECIEYCQRSNPLQIQGASQGLPTLQELVEERLQGCLLKMAIWMLGIGAIGIAMLIPMTNSNDKVQRELASKPQGCPSQYEALTSKVFYSIGLLVFISSLGNYFLNMNFLNFLPTSSASRAFLYWILISGALGNGLSRIVWGICCNKLGFKKVFAALMTINIIAFAAIALGALNGIFLVAYTLGSMSLGGLMVIFPNLSLLVFGTLGEPLYRYYWLIFSLSNLAQYFITQMLSATLQAYEDMMWIFLAGSLIAAIIAYFANLKGKWKVK